MKIHLTLAGKIIFEKVLYNSEPWNTKACSILCLLWYYKHRRWMW